MKAVLHEIAEDLMFDSIRVKCDCMKPQAKCECLVSIAGMVLIYEIELSLSKHAAFEMAYPADPLTIVYPLPSDPVPVPDGEEAE